MTKALDPRRGLRPNLDLLSAYAVYEKDYPLFKPDISATLAMNSPLYKRIDETLTEQSQLKAEWLSDEARMRGAAMAGNVPLEQLREMYRIFREQMPPPPPPGAPPPPPGAPPPDDPMGSHKGRPPSQDRC